MTERNTVMSPMTDTVYMNTGGVIFAYEMVPTLETKVEEVKRLSDYSIDHLYIISSNAGVSIYAPAPLGVNEEETIRISSTPHTIDMDGPSQVFWLIETDQRSMIAQSKFENIFYHILSDHQILDLGKLSDHPLDHLVENQINRDLIETLDVPWSVSVDMKYGSVFPTFSREANAMSYRLSM